MMQTMKFTFGGPFVKRVRSPHAIGPLSLLSCLSLALVYSGQTVGWIKMKLGTEVDLGPGNIVLDGARSPKRRTAPNFRPMYVVAKQLDRLRCHLVWYWRQASAQATVLDENPASPKENIPEF